MTPASGRHLAQDKADTNDIKREIEKTRVEMSETLNEIQERLRPDHLIQQAKDTVTEAATGKVRNIMHSASETATRVADQTRYAGRSAADYVRMHPVQMALLAGGITWWLLRGRDRSDDWEGASEGWQGRRLDTDFDTDAASDADRSLREKAGEYVSSARETVSEYASSARETAGEYADAARSTARRASQSVRDAASTASARTREAWQYTSSSVDDFVHDYPLAAGAVAVAVGAAIGLSVPGSRFEDRTLGERRDRAMEQARAKARELKETVTQRAKHVATAVEELTAPTTGSTTPASTVSSSTTGSV
jgi:ElaB/YqjD/DUF883 family membrane-anchored ribosome-binding protein